MPRRRTTSAEDGDEGLCEEMKFEMIEGPVLIKERVGLHQKVERLSDMSELR
jgi:hypothetical protein